MNSTAKILIYAAFIVFLVGLAFGLDYQWLTNDEMMAFGDRTSWAYWDTCNGMVRSNSLIHITGNPVFEDLVITTERDFWRGSGYNPIFLGGYPRFNAPTYPFPANLNSIRARASAYYANTTKQYRLRFQPNSVRIFRWNRGEPFDSSDTWTMTTGFSTTLFFDAPIEVSGIVTGDVTVGCSHNILIIDDLRYADADPFNGVTPASSNNYLALASEHDVKIANTPANGRDNSSGLGLSQQNRNLTSVVITAALYAIGGSFTFEQQNDADSGYVCTCLPDDRGTCYVYGGIAQHRRGYLHRANRSGTGYQRWLRYDRRFYHRTDYVFGHEHIFPDSVNFGSAPVGSTVRDTVHIEEMSPCLLSLVRTWPPFDTGEPDTNAGSYFNIPVSFTPTQMSYYHQNLEITTSSHHYLIPITGRGLHALGADDPVPLPISLSLSAFPNPFNATTTLSYTIEHRQIVRLEVFDVTGRSAAVILQGESEAGEHRVQFDGTDFTSGVYLARLSTPDQAVTHKLLLIK